MRVRCPALWKLAGLALVTGLLQPGFAMAQQLAWQTDLVGISQSNRLSSVAASMAIGGYDLSGGKYQSMVAFYTPPYADVRIDFLTTTAPNFGLLWGASTGEAAPKYKIDPSLRIGFIDQLVQFHSAFLTLSATSNLFGAMHEYSCMGDYPEFGGVQEVNCRLAASILSPEDTLKYLVHDVPARYNIVLSLSGTF
jgi:hypothetical protein